MFLVVSVKPFKAKLSPSLVLCKNFKKCYCLEQSVPDSLDDITLDLVPLTMLSKGARAVLNVNQFSIPISVY